MTEPLNLDELERITNAATEGPWTLFKSDRDTHDIVGAIGDADNIVVYAECDREDADFIVMARTAVPALIAELRQARAERRKR